MNKKVLASVVVTLIAIQIIYRLSSDMQSVYDYSPETQSTYMIYSENSNIVNDIMSVRIESLSPESIIFMFYNNTANNYTFGRWYELEKRTKSEWEAVDTIIDFCGAFPDTAYVLVPNGTLEKDFNWGWLHGRLESGEYRIRTKFTHGIFPGTLTYYITINFTI